MPVGDGADHPLPDEFHPQSGAFGAAGGAEPSLFAGEGDEIFVSADVAPDARFYSPRKIGLCSPRRNDARQRIFSRGIDVISAHT
jgi:hypothetical protein